MKRNSIYTLVIIVLSFLNTHLSYAQNNMSDIRKLKLEIVLNEMGLKQDTEKKFLPLYNKYSDDLWVVKKKLKDIETSNKNASQKVNERETYKQEILDIERKYKQDFLKIINASELEKMYRGEDKFRQKLIDIKAQKQ